MQTEKTPLVVGTGSLALTVNILRDECQTNPREDIDCLGRLTVRKSSHYGQADKDAEDFDVLAERIEEGTYDGVYLLRLSDGYSVRSVGKIDRANLIFYADAAKIREEYAESTPEEARDKAMECLKAEAETYRAWACGEVYGYVVKDAEGNEVASCWGFYGEVDYAEQEGKEEAEALHEQMKAAQAREVAAQADYESRL